MARKVSAVLVPCIAGAIMLLASVLPWLTDPVTGNVSAWRLPLDIGLQFHIAFINYGVLCACCTAYLWLGAYQNAVSLWGHDVMRLNRQNVPRFGRNTLWPLQSGVAGICCLVPLVLLIAQYTSIDVVGITTLAQHKTEVLLIQTHFGYGAPADRIALRPFDVDATTLVGRLILLVNQVSIGALLPLVSAWLLLDYGRKGQGERGRRGHQRQQEDQVMRPATANKRDVVRYWRRWLVSVVVIMALFGSGIVATLCEYQAKLALSSGSYMQALHWLDAAHALNPGLEQVPSYHIERGQAMYFLHPDQQDDDSRVYLAWVYRGQRDYLDAYQELLPLWQSHRHTTWVVSEMTTTLEYLSEYTKYLNGPVVKRPDNDDTALRWLLQITIVDSSNVYGQYQVGRVQCDLHNYPACSAYMLLALHLSNNADIQSSAYTYMGLSDIDLGEYVPGRELLFRAVQLDPDYRNNTAREELSGLH